MKKFLIILFAAVVATSAYANPPVNEKVLKVFNTTFPAVQNERWFESEKFYEVYFESGDMKCRIQYDKEGNILNTRRDYYGKDLCPFLKAKIGNKFPSKTIYGVTEMNNDEELYYVVVLEDEKTWMHVKVNPWGQMTTINKFNKAPKS